MKWPDSYNGFVLCQDDKLAPSDKVATYNYVNNNEKRNISIMLMKNGHGSYYGHLFAQTCISFSVESASKYESFPIFFSTKICYFDTIDSLLDECIKIIKVIYNDMEKIVIVSKKQVLSGTLL